MHVFHFISPVSHIHSMSVQEPSQFLRQVLTGPMQREHDWEKHFTWRQVLVSSSLAIAQQLLWKTGWRARNSDSSAGVQSAVAGWRDGGGCSVEMHAHKYTVYTCRQPFDL